MARAWKKVKRYERWVLIGITILLLATFSVTGITARGCGRVAEDGRDHGGSYEPVPGKRVEVSDREFLETYRRYNPIYSERVWGPSIRYAPEIATTDPKSRLDGRMATWVHIATVGAAEAAGYKVGPEELKQAIETMVLRAYSQRPDADPRLQGVHFSVELYDQVVARVYRGTKGEFERTVKEIVLKDKFLTPLVEGQRISADRQTAYDKWKARRERVDLQYVAVAAPQFREVVEKEEASRSAIGAVDERLQKLVAAARETGRIQGVVADWKAKNGGKLPADAAELATRDPGPRALGGKMPSDPWGKPYAYEPVGENGRVHSVGPDGQTGTPDDVGVPELDALNALAALRLAADGIADWKAATGARPASLADLLKAPPVAEGKPAAPPPLAQVPKDGWGRELVYESAGPVLLSTGPDGQRGTADDVAATFSGDEARIGVPASLAAHVGEAAKDGWGRPLEVRFQRANPMTFAVRSAGADGTPDTADDVVDGNATDIQTFYNGVKFEFQLEMRQDLEALYVIPALVPDAAFAEAWKRMPEHRPSEQDAWDLFRRTSFYVRGSPEGAPPGSAADPEKGFAAGLIASLREKGAIPKDGPVWQVPSAESFGDRKDPPAAGKDGLPSPEADPLYKAYVEQGWRQVVLRDLFFERLLDATLKVCRTASEARKTWERGGKKGEAPAAKTFADALAAWKDLQPAQADAERGARFVTYWASKPGQAVSREDLEAHPEFGDYTLPSAVQTLKDDEYPPIPTILREGCLRSVWHVVKRYEKRDPEFAEVREKAWPRYVERRCLARAARELAAVRADAEKAIAALPADATAESKVETLARIAKDVLGARGTAFTIERSGPFVAGATSAAAPTFASGATEEERAAARRRWYVRKAGYDEVKVLGSMQGRQEMGVGTVGRRVLEDDARGPDATASAYLVQVAWHRFPPPEEFHGGEYLSWLATEAYDLRPWEKPQGRLLDRAGRMVLVLARAYEDWDAAQQDYAIRTNQQFEIPREAGGRE